MPDKPKLVSCRLTDGDFETLQDHAESLGLSQSEYLRYLIRLPIPLDGSPPVGEYVILDVRTFGRIHTELIRWGRHYNQGVRALNTAALHLRRGKQDDEFLHEQLQRACDMLEKTEHGRQDIAGRLDRLETLALVGA